MMKTLGRQCRHGLKILESYISIRRPKRLLIVFVCVLVLIYGWKTWSLGSAPTSAIPCKNKIAEIVWPKEGERKKNLAPFGDDVFHLEDEFYHFVTTFTRNCYNQFHLGPSDDGGWEVCQDRNFDFKSPCLVYSFGVGHDFRFEEGIAGVYGCEVHAFDPSMGVESYQYSDKIHFHNYGIDNEDSTAINGRWEMRRLSTLMNRLGHSGKTLDYLKMDVEFSEWPALYDIIKTGTINQVRQLAVEVHTPEVDMHQRPNNFCTWSNKDTLAFMVKTLTELTNAGFSLYYSRTNYRTPFKSGLTQIDRYCCFDLHFVNMKHPQNKYVH